MEELICSIVVNEEPAPLESLEEALRRKNNELWPSVRERWREEQLDNEIALEKGNCYRVMNKEAICTQALEQVLQADYSRLPHPLLMDLEARIYCESITRFGLPPQQPQNRSFWVTPNKEAKNDSMPNELIAVDDVTEEAMKWAYDDACKHGFSGRSLVEGVLLSRAVLDSYASTPFRHGQNFVGPHFGRTNSALARQETAKKMKSQMILEGRYMILKANDQFHQNGWPDYDLKNISSWEEMKKLLATKFNFNHGRMHALAPTNKSNNMPRGVEVQHAFLHCGDNALEKMRHNLESKVSDNKHSALEFLKDLRTNTSLDFTTLLLPNDKNILQEQQVPKNNILFQAFYDSGPADEVVYEFGSDSIQRRSMHILRIGEWLNDEIINFYFSLLQERDKQKCEECGGSKRRSHFFKTFFMTKLLNEGHLDPAKDGKYDYRNVKPWSKKVPGKNIFELDKLFFPINLGRLHWCCCVAYMQEKRIQIYDSMGGDDLFYPEQIFRYIKDEYQARNKAELPDQHLWELLPCSNETPRQRNGK